ncbi:hypothetical protein BKA70DRAFT_1488363 [Coprinopsis sp. MPI-PUGE-AT-0042]|nr:hypothetical protein BKA70DRAFT_1488363 [Coprinopsis sp. MPI-PUGE-AT-0042]
MSIAKVCYISRAICTVHRIPPFALTLTTGSSSLRRIVSPKPYTRSLSLEACHSAAPDALLRPPQASPPIIHSRPYLPSPATCRLESLTTKLSLSDFVQIENQDETRHTTDPLSRDCRYSLWLAYPLATYCTFWTWTSSSLGEVSFSIVISITATTTTTWYGEQPSCQSWTRFWTLEISTSWHQAHRQQEIGWTYGEISYLPSVRPKDSGRMGTGNAEHSQDDFSASSSLAIQKSTRPTTARRECRPTRSERQPTTAYPLFATATTANRHFTKPSLRQPHPGEREIARDGASLLVNQFASELITTTSKFLKSIDDAPAHVQPNRLQTFASLGVKLLATLLQ